MVIARWPRAHKLGPHGHMLCLSLPGSSATNLGSSCNFNTFCCFFCNFSISLSGMLNKPTDLLQSTATHPTYFKEFYLFLCSLRKVYDRWIRAVQIHTIQRDLYIIILWQLGKIFFCKHRNSEIRQTRIQ